MTRKLNLLAFLLASYIFVIGDPVMWSIFSRIQFRGNSRDNTHIDLFWYLRR